MILDDEELDSVLIAILVERLVFWPRKYILYTITHRNRTIFSRNAFNRLL